MSKKQIFLFYNIKVNYLMETQGNIVFSFGEYFDVHDGGHVHIHHGQEQSDSDTKSERQDGKDEEKKKEELLREVLIIFASLIKGSHTYKWGLAKQALARKRMINPDISTREFAQKVNIFAGVPVNTVRDGGEYYVYDKSYEQSIQDLCSIIEKVLRDNS